MTRIFVPTKLIALAIFLLSQPIYAAIPECETTIEDITPNHAIQLYTIQCKALYGQPQTIHVIDANLNDKSIKLTPIKTVTNELQTLPEIAKQNNKVIAGVNGGFFYNSMNDPLYHDEICPAIKYPKQGPLGNSLFQIDGKVVTKNCDNNFNGNSHFARSVLGIPKEGMPFIKQIEPNTALTVEMQGKKDIVDAIGAGPNLVSSDSEGKPYVNIPNEGFGQWLVVKHIESGLKEFAALPEKVDLAKQSTWSFDVTAPNGEKLNLQYKKAASLYSPAPRTAVGLRKDNHLLLVTVNGRGHVAGMTLQQLAEFMISFLHVNSAMNLDGGGSTTMYIPGHNPEILTANSEKLRRISDGLFLVKTSSVSS